MKAIDRLLARVAAPMDGSLLSISGGLLLLGLLTLYSAASDNPARITSQLVNVGIALAAMWIAAQVPPQTLMRFAVPAYFVGLMLLLAVALFGDIRNGARRWLSLGFGSVQPSEVMKIAMPLMLAWYFHKNEAALRLRDYLVAAVLLAIPTLLIARQPDLGTALLVAAALLAAILAFLRLHIFGLALRGLIEHREGAAVVGVDIDRVQHASFALGFGSAAVAGALLSMTEQVSPFTGFPYTIAAFVVVIMGGLGSIGGGMLAALLLGLLETYGVALTSSNYRSILLYGVFVLVLLTRPQGLFGRRAIVR